MVSWNQLSTVKRAIGCSPQRLDLDLGSGRFRTFTTTAVVMEITAVPSSEPRCEKQSCRADRADRGQVHNPFSEAGPKSRSHTSWHLKSSIFCEPNEDRKGLVLQFGCIIRSLRSSPFTPSGLGNAACDAPPERPCWSRIARKPQDFSRRKMAKMMCDRTPRNLQPETWNIIIIH